MRGRLAGVTAGLVLALSGSGACAMTVAEPGETKCRVVGAERLPAEVGGADGVCSAIRDATAARAPGVGYDVEVIVASASRLAANIRIAGGRHLPELNHAISDRGLTSGSMTRFAAAIAGEIAKNSER